MNVEGYNPQGFSRPRRAGQSESLPAFASKIPLPSTYMRTHVHNLTTVGHPPLASAARSPSLNPFQF